MILILAAHHPVVCWTYLLICHLCVLGTLMHNRIRLYRIHSSKSTRTLKTITKLWVLQWACIISLLIHGTTWPVYNTLSGVYIACTILHEQSSSVSYISLFGRFSIGRLSAVDIHIILWVMHILESSIVWMIVHNWVIDGLATTSRFTRFLRSSSRLCCRIGCRVIDYVSLLERYLLMHWAILRLVRMVTALRYYCPSLRSMIHLIIYLISFHLDLLELFVELELLLMLSIWWKARPIIDITSSWYTILGCLNRILLHLLIYLLWVLVTWDTHTFLCLVVILHQNVLVRAWILAGKESALSLAFSTVLDHSLLWSRTLTFGNVANSFKVANNLWNALIILHWLRIILVCLLLLQGLFKL